jgi:hypothetical protein
MQLRLCKVLHNILPALSSIYCEDLRMWPAERVSETLESCLGEVCGIVSDPETVTARETSTQAHPAGAVLAP